MTLSEIDACLKILFDHARAMGVERIEVGENDLYWTISSLDWLAIYNEPKPSVGSFADDEAELRKVMNDPSRAGAVDLERVAHLLKLLSESLSK